MIIVITTNDNKRQKLNVIVITTIDNKRQKLNIIDEDNDLDDDKDDIHKTHRR